MDIGLQNIEYAIVRISDYRLIWAALEKTGKTVIVTGEEDRWKNLIENTGYDLSDFNITFSDGDGSKIRGYRANNIFILSDCDLEYDQVQDIISGFVSVSDNPVKSIKEYARNKALGITETRVEHDEFQIIWNKKS